MKVYEISLNDGVDSITLLNDDMISDKLPDLPLETVYPIGAKFYFATNKTGNDMSQAFRNSFEEYKKTIAEMEWLLSLRFKHMSEDTIAVKRDELLTEDDK